MSEWREEWGGWVGGTVREGMAPLVFSFSLSQPHHSLIPPSSSFLSSSIPSQGLGTQFWLNLLLTILGWLPGVVHALWVLFADRGL